MSDQRQLFDHDLYLHVCGRNIRKVQSVIASGVAAGTDEALANVCLGMLAATRRLEMVIAKLMDLRVLPADFELLYELELEKELSEL